MRVVITHPHPQSHVPTVSQSVPPKTLSPAKKSLMQNDAAGYCVEHDSQLQTPDWLPSPVNVNYSFSLCNDKFYILYFNARSVLPKFDQLNLVVDVHHPHIICVVETWLCNDILDNELFISGYQLFCFYRNRHGGGILMYVNNTLCNSTLLPLPP